MISYLKTKKRHSLGWSNKCCFGSHQPAALCFRSIAFFNSSKGNIYIFVLLLLYNCTCIMNRYKFVIYHYYPE
jgi:hypothetical protein